MISDSHHSGSGLDGEYMAFALLIAAATHAILIFGVGFQFLATSMRTPTLEVTLAQYRSEAAPQHADYLAQVNQDGSGDQPDKAEITTDQIPVIADLGDGRPAIPQQATGTRKPPSEIVTTTSPTRKSHRLTREQGQAVAEAPADAATALEIGGLYARLADKRLEYARYPRTLRLTAVSAKTAEQAAYLNYWVARVEAIGNQHYPEEARRKRIFGGIRLAVNLHSDGSVAAVDILQSSGQRVLDQAAIRSVRLASPFAHFPVEMRAWDRVEIIRTWHFTPRNRVHTR